MIAAFFVGWCGIVVGFWLLFYAFFLSRVRLCTSCVLQLSSFDPLKGTLTSYPSHAVRKNWELQDRPQKGGRPCHLVTERLAAASAGIPAQQADFKKYSSCSIADTVLSIKLVTSTVARFLRSREQCSNFSALPAVGSALSLRCCSPLYPCRICLCPCHCRPCLPATPFLYLRCPPVLHEVAHLSAVVTRTRRDPPRSLPDPVVRASTSTGFGHLFWPLLGGDNVYAPVAAGLAREMFSSKSAHSFSRSACAANSLSPSLLKTIPTLIAALSHSRSGTPARLARSPPYC